MLENWWPFRFGSVGSIASRMAVHPRLITDIIAPCIYYGLETSDRGVYVLLSDTVLLQQNSARRQAVRIEDILPIGGPA